jgi:hypothetical protein
VSIESTNGTILILTRLGFYLFQFFLFFIFIFYFFFFLKKFYKIKISYVYFVGDFPTQEKIARSVNNTSAVLLDGLKQLIVVKMSVTFSNNQNTFFFLDHKGEVYSFGFDYKGSSGIFFYLFLIFT